MAEPLRKLPLEEETELIESKGISGPELTDTTPSPGVLAVETASTENVTRRAAESVGAGVGTAVREVRNSVRAGLDVVSERSQEASARLAEVADETRDRVQDLALEAGRVAQDMREAAIYRAQKLRRETRTFANERPLETVLLFSGVAFVLGVALRIWRSNHD
jgi:ElaB/YqjD/DUF883 family membrane-anchored ribosome-binding protein